MKKSLLAFILFAVVQWGAYAQTYTFSQTTATYTDLVTPTLITNTTLWDDTSVIVPIGFPFVFGGVTYSNVEINTNGILLFATATSDAAVVGYDADLASQGTTTSTSPIGYLVTGTTGSRIFKVEFKNSGFYDGTPADFVNFQIWLYEGSNKVEVRLGPSNIGIPVDIFGSFGGPAVGVATSIDFVSETLNGLFLQGSPSAATGVPLTNSPFYPFLSAPPTNGTVYVFTASALSLPETLHNARISVYPNPVAEVLQIEGLAAAKGKVTVNVYNVLGKVVLTQQVNAASLVPVNVKSLSKGTYLVEIISGNERAGKQIFKL